MTQSTIFFGSLTAEGAAQFLLDDGLGGEDLQAHLELLSSGLLHAGESDSPLYQAVDQFLTDVRNNRGDVTQLKKELDRILRGETPRRMWKRLQAQKGKVQTSLSSLRFARRPTTATTVLAPDGGKKKGRPKQLPPQAIATPRTLEKIFDGEPEKKLQKFGWGILGDITIQSPEEARLVLEFFAATDVEALAPLKRAAQEALRLNIPIHWVCDPDKETSYTKRSEEEVKDWEKRPALQHGIFLSPSSNGFIRGKTLFHELAHALPQKIVAELFPQIPWVAIPSKTDSYAETVYKELLRMSMQEAYAFALSHGRLPNFERGEHLGDNHVVLYTFYAAIQNAKKIGRGEGHGGWDEDVPIKTLLGMEVLDRLREAFGELQPLVLRITGNPQDPLYGYVRRLQSVLLGFDLREVKGRIFERDVHPVQAKIDVTDLSGREDLLRILETHARSSRRLANVVANAGEEKPLATLSLLIPSEERGRFWGGVEEMVLHPGGDRMSYLSGLETAEALWLEGFSKEAERLLRSILYRVSYYRGVSVDESGFDVGTDFNSVFPIIISRLGTFLTRLARFGSPEAIDSYLHILLPEAGRDFLSVYAHGEAAETILEDEVVPAEIAQGSPDEMIEKLRQFYFKRSSLPDEESFQRNVVQPFLSNCPDLPFFIELFSARKHLIERGLQKEAKQIEAELERLAPLLPEREKENENAFLALQLSELISVPPELGGGWEKVAQIMEAIGREKGEYPQEAIYILRTLNVLARKDTPLPPNEIRERLAKIWAEMIDVAEGGLADGKIGLRVVYGDRIDHFDYSDLRPSLERLKMEGSPKETEGLHFILEESLKLYRFAKAGEGTALEDIADGARFRIKTEALNKKGKPRGMVWDAIPINPNFSEKHLLFQLGSNPHLYWVALLIEEGRSEEALSAIEEGIASVPAVHQTDYARLLFRVKSSHRDNWPKVDRREWERHHFFHGKRRDKLRREGYEAYLNKLERERFLSLLDRQALGDIRAILGRASIYDVLSADDWLLAADAFDRQKNGSADLVFALYGRGVDVAEMEGEPQKIWLTALDRIDRSTHLTAEQKDILFTEVAEVLLVFAREGLRKEFRFSNDLLSDPFKKGGKIREEGFAEKFHDFWERARQGNYVRAQKTLLAGMRQLQEEMATEDPLGAIVLFDPFVREVALACGDSCTTGPLADQTLGSTRVLGTTFFGESDFLPFSLTSLERNRRPKPF